MHRTKLCQSEEEQSDIDTAEPKKLKRMNDKVITNKYCTRQPSNVTRIDVTLLSKKEINEKIKELYQKRDGIWSCLSCDFTSIDKSSSGNIRRHVETHIDGLSYKCNLCIKEFPLKDNLYRHKYTEHKF